MIKQELIKIFNLSITIMSQEISSIMYFLDIDIVEKEWYNICKKIFRIFVYRLKQEKLELLIKLLNEKNYDFIKFVYKINKRDSGFYFDISILVKDRKTNEEIEMNFMVLSIHINREDLESIKEYTIKKDYTNLNLTYQKLVSKSENGIIHIHSDNKFLFRTRDYNCNFKLTQSVEKVIEEPAAAAAVSTPPKIYIPSFQIEYIKNQEARENKVCLLLQPIFDSFMLSIEEVLFSKRYMINQFRTTYNILLSNLKENQQDKIEVIKSSRKLFGEKYLKYKMKYLALKNLLQKN